MHGTTPEADRTGAARVGTRVRWEVYVAELWAEPDQSECVVPVR